MSRTVSLNITLQDAEFPAGTQFAGFKFSLVSPAGPAAESTTTDTFVQFSSVPAGSYTATVAALDAAGATLGSPISIAVTVVDEVLPPVVVPVPALLSFSLS